MITYDFFKKEDEPPNWKVDITETPEKAFFSKEMLALKPLSEMKID